MEERGPIGDDSPSSLELMPRGVHPRILMRGQRVRLARLKQTALTSLSQLIDSLNGPSSVGIQLSNWADTLRACAMQLASTHVEDPDLAKILGSIDEHMETITAELLAVQARADFGGQ